MSLAVSHNAHIDSNCVSFIQLENKLKKNKSDLKLKHQLPLQNRIQQLFQKKKRDCNDNTNQTIKKLSNNKKQINESIDKKEEENQYEIFECKV